MRLRRGDLGIARDALRRALALDPECGSARHTLVLVHLSRDEHRAAARELDVLIAQRPDALGYAVDRAALHFEAGERALGLARLDGVLGIDPDDERARTMRSAVLDAGGSDDRSE